MVAYVDEKRVNYFFGVNAIIFRDASIGHRKIGRRCLRVGQFFMKTLGVGATRTQVMDAVFMWTVKLGKLFGKYVDREVGELKRQGNDLLPLGITE